MESEIGNMISNSELVCCIHFHRSTYGFAYVVLAFIKGCSNIISCESLTHFLDIQKYLYIFNFLLSISYLPASNTLFFFFYSSSKFMEAGKYCVCV